MGASGLLMILCSLGVQVAVFLRSGMDFVVRSEWPPGTQCGMLQSKVMEPELQGTSAMVDAPMC